MNSIYLTGFGIVAIYWLFGLLNLPHYRALRFRDPFGHPDAVPRNSRAMLTIHSALFIWCFLIARFWNPLLARNAGPEVYKQTLIAFALPWSICPVLYERLAQSKFLDSGRIRAPGAMTFLQAFGLFPAWAWFLAIELNPPAQWPALTLAAVLGGIGLLKNRNSRRILPGIPFELEDSPLRSALMAMAKVLKMQMKAIKVVPTTYRFRAASVSASDKRKFHWDWATYYWGWWLKLSPYSPTLPLEFVNATASSTVEAAYAIKVMQNTAMNMKNELVASPRSTFSSRGIFSGCAAVPAVIFVILVINLRDFPGLPMVGKVVYGIALAMMSWITYLALGSGKADESTHPPHLGFAFDLWSSAEPTPERSPNAFLTEIGRIYCLFNASDDDSVVLADVMDSKALNHYLSRLEEHEHRSGMKAIRRGISEICVEKKRLLASA
ncbi:MAG: hypothetical protein K1X53_02710 [Candidatus Sumerlaeaceae bacterium]|nr:hypothetical protein [Candidatus Sumerlaeaceae bacterium]